MTARERARPRSARFDPPFVKREGMDEAAYNR